MSTQKSQSVPDGLVAGGDVSERCDDTATVEALIKAGLPIPPGQYVITRTLQLPVGVIGTRL